MGFYCKEKSCQKVICPLCMLEDHRSHDVVDVAEMEDEKRDLSRIKEFLLSCKEKLFIVQQELERSRDISVDNIKEQRDELVTRLDQNFDKMKKDVNDTAKTLNDDVADEIAIADELLEEIKRNEENTETPDTTRIDSRIEEQVIERFSRIKIYKYNEYKKSARPPELLLNKDLESLCGEIVKTETKVDFRTDCPVDEPPIPREAPRPDLDSLVDQVFGGPREAPRPDLIALVEEVFGGQYKAVSASPLPLQPSQQIRTEGKTCVPKTGWVRLIRTNFALNSKFSFKCTYDFIKHQRK